MKTELGKREKLHRITAVFCNGLAIILTIISVAFFL